MQNHSTKKEGVFDMLPEKTLSWGLSRNCMRELSAYGARRKQEIGAENVYDFALGNPSVLPPDIVNQSIIDIIREEGDTVHAYTTAAGILSLRRKIADDLNDRFHMNGWNWMNCDLTGMMTIGIVFEFAHAPKACRICNY